MNVAVVGGGIVGVASAYELAARGADVTLFERGSLGAGSTDRALGGIRAQFSTRINVELSVASIAVWDAFAERFGVDIDRRRTGYLFLTREQDTADAFAEQVAMQREFGVDSRLAVGRVERFQKLSKLGECAGEDDLDVLVCRVDTRARTRPAHGRHSLDQFARQR